MFNLAESADIFVNATCGRTAYGGPEIYCYSDDGPRGLEQCGVCDDTKPDKAHPVQKALDFRRADTWWQSPSLANGQEFHYVTITVDLKKVILSCERRNPQRSKLDFYLSLLCYTRAQSLSCDARVCVCLCV